jgi:two-component system LytT family response regulator
VVIFVTAYDKYAVKAFECHALDYLLKPISEERFKESMQLAISQIGRDRLEAYADRLELLVRDYIKISQRNLPAPEIRPSVTSGDFLVWLTVRSRGQISMIPVQEVDWIESAGDYVYIHSNSKKLLTRETLIFLEKRMDPRRFVRIHRSAIVNLERVSSLKPNDHGDCEVVLQNGDRLRLSRSYRKHFQKAIGNSI